MNIEITKGKNKSKKKLVFDSKYYYDKGDYVEVALPKGDTAQVFRIDKANIREVEQYKEKKKKNERKVNPLTQF